VRSDRKEVGVMDDPKGGQTRSELVSFDMPALPHMSSSAGRFSGQVAMPAQLMSNKEALNLLMSAGTCSGVGVAVWPSRGGAILYAGETQGKQMSGVGLIEFPSARSTWSMASGKFENGAFSFGRASAGDVFDFVDRPWQEFIRTNIQKKTSWTASVFKGQWRNGYPSQGITILPDGSMHVGSWKDGKFHDSCLFVDSEGSWIKGIFNNGRLINVTFRSFMKCRIPEIYSHLLTSAELANIPADVLQGEYKSFIDIADKLSVQGVEMSKLAKSISNIAFLKSEQVLGLPTHAVESSLNSLLHLVTKSPSPQNISSSSNNTNAGVVPTSAPAPGGANNSPSGGGGLAQQQTAAGLLQQLLQMQQNLFQQSQAGGSATQQQVLVNQQQQKAPEMRKTLPALATTTAALPTPTAPIEILQSTKAGASNESNVLSTAKTILKMNREKSKEEPPPQDKIPGDLKVGILSVQPPIVSTGESREITIDGFCTGEEGWNDISVLCISGNKFVKCKTVLKKLEEGANIHRGIENTPGMSNFELTLSLSPDAVGITYFLFASNKSQLPYPMEKTLGPCKATLTMSEQTSEYHVAPVVVCGVEMSNICQEIKHRLLLVSNHSRLEKQERYQKVAEFLQHFGTFVGGLDEMNKKENKDFKDSSVMQTIYLSLVQHASKLCLPITFEYLESKQNLFRLDEEETKNVLNTHLFELIHKYLRVPSSSLLSILDCCINAFKIPVDAILDRAGMKTSALHLIASSEHGTKLLKMLSKSPQRNMDWFSLKDGLGAVPLKCAKQKQLRKNADYLEEIRFHLEREKARNEEEQGGKAEGEKKDDPVGGSDTTTISQPSKGSQDAEENKQGVTSTAIEKIDDKSNGQSEGGAEEMEVDDRSNPKGKGGDIVKIKVIQDHQERASRSIKRKLSQVDPEEKGEETIA
jgi:hypothetical protein